MSRIESYYNDFYRDLSIIDEAANHFNKIESLLPNLNGEETFLDIGCGHGGVCSELINKGFNVSGIEINDEAIDSLKSKGFKTYHRDITKPLNINYKFDIILILDVLEHLFDPLHLLNEAKNITKPNGYIIVTIPLYFDIIDRLKILFTGSIISMDNLCYGKDIYLKFRSYNYDHIRFFRPKDIYEIGDKLDLFVDKIEFTSATYMGESIFLKYLFKIIANKYTVNFNPNLLAHVMKIRWKVR